jgi:peptide/nickel transport system permease protein
VAALIAVLLAVAALVGPFFAADPLAQDAEARLQPPGQGHLFGTDGFGRDVLSRVLHGARVSLAIALASVAAASLIGTALGSLSGYIGGRIDLLFQRFVDLLLGFPSIVFSIVVIVSMSPSPVAIGTAILVAIAPRMARIARAAALVAATEEYVLAARALGVGPVKIVARHILPNVVRPVAAQLSVYFGTAIVAEATLSFLGLGVPPPYPSLGRMLQEGSRQYFEAAPWVTLFPGLFIAGAVVCFAMVADALAYRLESPGG